MNRSIQYLLVLTVFVMCGFSVSAKENVGSSNVVVDDGPGKVEDDCNPSSSFTELNINNVRAGLLNGGDIWWDLTDAKYEVPKVDPESGEPSRHSLFAGALWIGGIDNLGNLKVAAQTYRQTGNDFWPGPLDANGQIEQSVCSSFDKFWEVKGADVDILVALLEDNGGIVAPADVPESILQWPGQDNPFFNEFALPPGESLAPYFESGVSAGYDPTTGDLPVIDPTTPEPVYADQMIWWVFNDKGNVHSETGGQAIGLEIKALAFAFATNDCINDMTFYRYVISNTSTAVLDSVYFGQWVDPDLGNFNDDYVGCVVDEGLGIVYNGDAEDEGVTGYGTDIPMLGVDFFEGPKVDLNMDGDVLDEGEELGMTSFVYYNNDFTSQGNPETADHFYGYLAGVWKDKSQYTFGGTGFQSGGEPTNFMFPTDPTETSDDAWSECSEGNPPADRRFLQVSGPFQLQPGAINNIIVGVVWIRDGVQHPCPSFDSMIECDQKAQALFDNDFKTLRGPDAPEMSIRELDKELILSIFNESTSNNFNEEYVEADPILRSQGIVDSTYRFQGYRIYQLSESNISPAQFDDIDVAREIFSVDIAGDDVTTLVNWLPVAGLGVDAPEVQVIGSDNGVQHTFNVQEDQFALGDKKLINHKRYYFAVVAYGHNNYADYNPLEPDAGQSSPYLAGARNITVYTAIPHLPTPQNGGTVLNSSYGSGPEITQVSGEGNGGISLELTEASLQTIIEQGFIEDPVYQSGSGPVKVQVYDPLLVQDESYVLKLINSFINVRSNPKNGTVDINSDGTITYTPNDGFAGIDFMEYDVADANGAIDIGIVRFVVGDIDFGPNVVATDLSINDTGTTLDIDVEDAVFGNVALPFTVTGVGNAFNGELEIRSETEIAYIPDPGFFGYDFFDYTVTNIANQSSTARVHIFVRDPLLDGELPLVEDDTYIVSGAGTFSPLDNDEIICDLALGTFCNNTEEIDASILSKQSRWTLTSSSGVVYTSSTTIELADEQAIGGWRYDPACVSNTSVDCDQIARPLGFTVTVNQVDLPFKRAALMDVSFNFPEGVDPWLIGISDQDGDRADNWIMSGSAMDDYPGYDVDSDYENIGDGGVSPYALTRFTGDLAENTITTVNGFILPMAPSCPDCGGRPDNTINDLHSVDLYITPNKDLWSQCPVVEMGRVAGNNIGNATKNELRDSPSRDIDGNNVSGETGRSYFPGYAVNVETGQRMNIMFAENSRMGGGEGLGFNATDMLWNPTAERSTATGGETTNGYRMGGEHWIYIMDSQYDKGQRDFDRLSAGDEPAVYDEAMWVVAPLLAEGLVNGDTYKSIGDGLVPAEAKIRIRMSRPYEETEANTSPEYHFNMGDFKATTGDVEAAESALDMVQVVPNPYYAFSEYENTKFDNTVKITNLPDRAEVNIYTLDGTWVNSLSLDNTSNSTGTSLSDSNGTTENSLSWNITNWRNVPVASGMYIIHVSAPDIGEEKVLKWFGVMRPIDLDSF